MVLVTLWIGALMAVVIRWEPWVFQGESTASSVDYRWIEVPAPDGLRECVADTNTGPWKWSIVDAKSKARLATIPATAVMAVNFLNDDNLEFREYQYLETDVVPIRMHERRIQFRRRFPEWWWGHFYRPEVWCALVLTALLGWRFIGRNRQLTADK